MKYIPMNDYVIVKKQPQQNVTPSGILIQTTQGSDTAVVVANGEVSSLSVGDVIMIRWSNALKIDSDIYAVSYKEVVTKLVD